MNERGRGILGRRDATSEEIREAMGEAIYVALRRHKQMGVPAATLKDGEVILVPPEEIVIPDDGPATDDEH